MSGVKQGSELLIDVGAAARNCVLARRNLFLKAVNDDSAKSLCFTVYSRSSGGEAEVVASTRLSVSHLQADGTLLGLQSQRQSVLQRDRHSPQRPSVWEQSVSEGSAARTDQSLVFSCEEAPVSPFSKEKQTASEQTLGLVCFWVSFLPIDTTHVWSLWGIYLLCVLEWKKWLNDLSYISGNNYHFTSARRAGREPVHSHKVHLFI